MSWDWRCRDLVADSPGSPLDTLTESTDLALQLQCSKAIAPAPGPGSELRISAAPCSFVDAIVAMAGTSTPRVRHLRSTWLSIERNRFEAGPTANSGVWPADLDDPPSNRSVWQLGRSREPAGNWHRWGHHGSTPEFDIKWQAVRCSGCAYNTSSGWSVAMASGSRSPASGVAGR